MRFLIIFYLLFSFPLLSAIITSPQMEQNCRLDIRNNTFKGFIKYARYFGIIPLSDAQPYLKFYPYPLNSKTLTFFNENQWDKFITIDLKTYESDIDKEVRRIKLLGRKFTQVIDALHFLKSLLDIRKNFPSSTYPCLSLYFQECDSLECRELAFYKFKYLYSLTQSRTSFYNPADFRLLDTLQEYLGLYGKLSDWIIKPNFEGPEEMALFESSKEIKFNDEQQVSPVNIQAALVKRGAQVNNFYPRIPFYFPTNQYKCLFNKFEKSRADKYIQSDFYKNQCWQHSFVHPIRALKELISYFNKSGLPIDTFTAFNGSYLFHGTTSRYFAYGFYKKVLQSDNWLIKSRMLITGAKLLVGEADITKTQKNVAWISTSSITGFQKAFAYSGVYVLPDSNKFYYGPPYPDRAAVAGLGFFDAKKTWDQSQEEKQKNEEEQLSGMTDENQKFYFKENFPMTFGFKIPKSFLVSKKGVEWLNEILWFGGFKLELLKSIMVPRKYLDRVKSFLKERGDFSQVKILAFEDVFVPVTKKFFEQRLIEFENKVDRKKEWELVQDYNKRFSEI